MSLPGSQKTLASSITCALAAPAKCAQGPVALGHQRDPGADAEIMVSK